MPGHLQRRRSQKAASRGRSPIGGSGRERHTQHRGEGAGARCGIYVGSRGYSRAACARAPRAPPAHVDACL
eukprot:1131934-Prymnesium_polylepis.1